MHSRRWLAIARWSSAFLALAGIVLVYRRWLHVNPTTVALSLLLLILLLAAEWGLRYAIAVSIAATACYNFYFLPPVGTFTIADPQNWLALFAFLSTAVIASRLSDRARSEAAQARERQRELEVLLRLSRELLHSESADMLTSSIPSAVVSVTAAQSGLLYLAEGERLYQTGGRGISRTEIPHLRQLTVDLRTPKIEAGEMLIPLHTGVRTKGLLLLRGATLSLETAQAIGSLLSLSIDRAQALENVARGNAAKESDRLRTLMIDSITHELRTPLTSIKGAATALRAGDLPADSAHELILIIDEESDRLNKLVAEAVETAQLDAHEVQMHFATVPVSSLIREARETCRSAEEQHPLRIQVPEELEVHVDPVVLQKVICNLLDNAAKYSAPGSPINVAAEVDRGGVSITIADQGIGIDPSEQSLVFERFYRARPESGVSGTGMGLAISRVIVEAHGGSISVTSQVGRGSVFTLWLPAPAV